MDQALFDAIERYEIFSSDENQQRNLLIAITERAVLRLSLMKNEGFDNKQIIEKRSSLVKRLKNNIKTIEPLLSFVERILRYSNESGLNEYL